MRRETKKGKRDYGPCIFDCGRRATSPAHGTCGACYSSCRYWTNVKTPAERAERQARLLLYQARMSAIGTVVRIGTRARPTGLKKTTRRKR